jgi:hypothetical protein
MSRSRYIADFIVSSNDIANSTITFSDIGLVYTANIVEEGNLYYTNNRTYSNVLNLLPQYTGNATAGNVIISGKFIGDGSLLTGLGAATLSGLVGYGGNALFGTNVLVTGNVSTGNILVSGKIIGDGSLITNITTFNIDENSNLYYTNSRVYANISPLLTTANVNEVGSNLYYTNARVLSNVALYLPEYTGNLKSGNVIVSGKFFGDGSALTGISGLGNLPVYGGNILAQNVVITSNLFVSGANITGANIIAINNIIASNVSSGNVIVSDRLIGFSANLTSNVTAANVVAGKFYGDGSGITNLSGTLSGLPTYAGNILGNNVTITSNVSAENANVTAGNIMVTGKIIGDGSGIINLTGTLASLPTYAGNALLDNVTITGNISAELVNITVANVYTYGNVEACSIIISGKYYGDGSQLAGVLNPSALITYNANLLAENVTVRTFLETSQVRSRSGIITSNAAIDFRSVTTSERSSTLPTANGRTIFNSDVGFLQYWNGSRWQNATNVMLPGSNNNVIFNEGNAFLATGNLSFISHLNELRVDNASTRKQEMGYISGTANVDLRRGTYVNVGFSGTTTVSFSNVSSAFSSMVVLKMTNGGGVTLNWPSNMRWAGGTAPTFSSGNIDLVSFLIEPGNSSLIGILLASTVGP